MQHRRIDPRHVVDVFLYVVVLNLAIEYVPMVISETFTISLLTAVMLKLVLEVVVAVKKRAQHRVRSAESRAGKVVGLAMLAVILPGSKIVVLELTALVFGSRVQLGGFWFVTALVIVLMLGRAGVRRLLVDDRGPEARPTAPS